MPVPQLLTAARAQLGRQSCVALPTLCWLNSAMRFSIFFAAPVRVSLLLVIGFAPILCLAVLFVLYLSLTIAGQTFFSFQWDILLLETGFLAIFLAPWRWWPRFGQSGAAFAPGAFPSSFSLFKLMLLVRRREADQRRCFLVEI